jgi:hypothetical protein
MESVRKFEKMWPVRSGCPIFLTKIVCVGGTHAYGKNDRLIEPMAYIGLGNTFCRDSEYIWDKTTVLKRANQVALRSPHAVAP